MTQPIKQRQNNAPPVSKGRPKGSQNKATKALKEMILGALDDAGGQDYLMRQATENPAAFMTLIGKVLPATINADVNATVGVTRIEHVIVDPAPRDDA